MDYEMMSLSNWCEVDESEDGDGFEWNNEKWTISRIDIVNNRSNRPGLFTCLG